MTTVASWAILLPIIAVELYLLHVLLLEVCREWRELVDEWKRRQ